MELIVNILRYLWYIVEEPKKSQNKQTQNLVTKEYVKNGDLWFRKCKQSLFRFIYINIEGEKTSGKSHIKMIITVIVGGGIMDDFYVFLCVFCLIFLFLWTAYVIER